MEVSNTNSGSCSLYGEMKRKDHLSDLVILLLKISNII
jgi:hypothetical protein